jgi:hypothetical protein
MMKQHISYHHVTRICGCSHQLDLCERYFDVYGGADGTRDFMGVADAEVEQHLGSSSDPCRG